MTYIISRLLVTVDPQTRVLLNTRTGDRMEVSEEVIRLLELFKEPATIEGVVNEVSDTVEHRSTIRAFLTDLIENQILVSNPEQSYGAEALAALPNRALVETPHRGFFGCPSRTLEALEDDAIVFLGIPFDLGTTGFPGARFGPNRMRDLSADAFEYQADIFTGLSKGWFSTDWNKTILTGVKMADIGNILFHVGEEFPAIFERVQETLRLTLEKGCFPVVLGGDHSCTHAVIKGVSQAYPDLRLIQIDAHTDLGDLFPGICHNHGNVMTRILEEDLVGHLYQWGQRGLGGRETTSPKCTTFSLSRLQQQGIKVSAEALDCRYPYHLSLDIDVLDPSVAPGTGTPLANGMSAQALWECLSAIAQRVRIVSIDLVEVNPMLDPNDRTANIALGALFHLLGEVFAAPRRFGG